MPKEPGGHISLIDAMRAVGHALFGDEWAGQLSHRECFLIEKYPPPSERPAPTIRFPGSGLTVVDMAFPPVGSELENEWIAAYTKEAFKRYQEHKALAWLKDAGFDIGQEVLDHAAFETAYGAEFKNTVPRTAAPATSTTSAAEPIASSPGSIATPVTLLNDEKKKQDFIDWMEAEKKKHGTYPPRDPDKAGRPCWAHWARDHKVRRKTAREWVKAENLHERSGAPKNLAKNNSAAELPN